MFINEKPLEWIASSYKDLLAFPAEVRQRFGFALSLAQMGERYEKTRILNGFSGAAVLEILEDHIGDTFQAVYTVKFEEAVFVLHCFQKKSKSGIATPQTDMEIIRTRLKIATARAEELRHHAKNNR